MKIYKDMNVFDATMERIKFAFENFDNIYGVFLRRKRQRFAAEYGS